MGVVTVEERGEIPLAALYVKVLQGGEEQGGKVGGEGRSSLSTEKNLNLSSDTVVLKLTSWMLQVR